MSAIILTAIWGVVMMFGSVLFKTHAAPKYWAIAGIVIVLAANIAEFFGYPLFNIDVHAMLRFDKFGLLFNTIAFGCTLLYFLLNGRDIEKVGSNVSEYFALIFFVLCGVSISSSFNTLLMLFLGIEIMSIPLYILTGSDKNNLRSNEAALKYFLMGSFSTGIMLMGIAFLYGGNALASFNIEAVQLNNINIPVMISVGLVLMVVALSFKVSAAPFHFWTPDVYDGAPTVFTSFMATIVKVAGFVTFLRLFKTSYVTAHLQWQPLVVILVTATLFIGNFTAVFQQSVKRMLAYSSIAQAGFMLLAVFALNTTANEGLLLYSAAYSLASIGLFAIVVKMNDFTIEGFNGLGNQQPVLAFTATIFLLSLTGIPLTAGFTAKFYMLLAALKTGHQFWLVIFAVLCAAVSAYYYFRIIQAMYFKQAVTANTILTVPVSKRFKWLLIFTAAILILLGIMPGLIVDWLYY